ncbi:TetR/AcrR family transcriptional regulator [Sphingopyxis kveilinensis]|uniref:TetR/AcrR family transcriptional regulator n=1 Tax=Sphingopyxis kveilinensis TaxID=3114367 RepID=UPI0030CFA297
MQAVERQRKEPRQQRSISTVATLIEACAQVLIQDGYEAATTTRIAARAGVSIGSLYQYFPDKDALVSALISRHVDAIMTATDLALADGDIPLGTGLRRFVRMAADVRRVDPRLHRILSSSWLAEANSELMTMATVYVTDKLANYLTARNAELAPDCSPRFAAVIIERSVQAVVHAHCSSGNEAWATCNLEAELTRLAVGYAKQGLVEE